MSVNRRTNQHLGYPADARLLIVNADDFGMCHAVNQAIIGAFQAGVVRSTSLMVPCPWYLHAAHFLADHPEMPFAIHLTAIGDGADYRLGPVIAGEKVRSLVDAGDLTGLRKPVRSARSHFYTFGHMTEFLAHVNLDELEREFRAQIEIVLAAGLHLRTWTGIFLTSQRAKDIIREEGIILLDYRALQAVWKEM